MKIHSFFILSIFLPIFCVTGCLTTPFAPVAVPNAFSIKAERPVDQCKIYTELKNLQIVKPSEYHIAPDDSFSVVVMGNTELSRPSVNVLSDGSIYLAPIGKIHVAGLTLTQASALLSEKLKKYTRNPIVTLEPILTRKQVFTVVGMVGAPGIYPIAVGNTRLRDAIAIAKGLNVASKDDSNNFADFAKSYISRNGRVLPVDFDAALIKGDTLHNIPILDGDYIYIAPATTGKVTILGEVDDPSSIPYVPNLTLVQAIGLVGGLKTTNSCEIKVIRGGLANPVVYTLPIEEILMGRLKDFPLERLDIVYVPRDGLTKWNIIVGKILPSIQLLNGLAGPFGSPSSFLFKND